ncbi:MAG TPA: hypothetical protein DGZ24_08110 [Rhodospirillaceae bacterium]|nr:hypothetical protein [Candidatus Neomarinimicrobiota bacterium]HCX15266.1 hypothetical protein [Rhodospirillaceae bacterium]
MDSNSERKLRDLRLNLAEICLEGRADRIARLTRNPSGDALLTLINSGVRHLVMTKADQAVAERCHRILSVEHEIERKVCAYLALSLFSFPHVIQRSFDIIDVPTPILGTVVKVLLAIPPFFKRDSTRRQALNHVESSVQEIHKAVRVIDEPDFQKEILAGFMEGYVISSVYAEDVPLRNLAQQRAELIRMYLEQEGLAQDKELPARLPEETTVSLGVLCPGTTSETAALRGHLSGLDRGVFQVTAFVPEEAKQSIGASFEDLVDDCVVLPTADIVESARIIGGKNLDVLMVGANVTNSCKFPWTLLMSQRLARLQVAMHSSNLTTGFAEVDLYINGHLNESNNAQDEYTEELVLIPGSSNHYAFPGPTVVPEAITREQIGIPDAALLLVSGANYFKIGPDLVSAWARVLENAPTAHIFLYPFNPNWTTHYPHKDGFLRFIQERFAARGVGIDRVHVLETQPSRAPILGMLQLADLYLDSFPYAGAVSLIDPLLAGCPPIVRDGHAARCRQSAALLYEIGLDVLVTKSTEDYIKVVTRLIQDHGLRREMREAIADVADHTALSAQVGIGRYVGDVLLTALKKKLKTAAL